MLKKDQCWRCDTICSGQTAKMYCGRCEVAYYCSDKCKRSDEFRHQVDCQTAALKRKCSGRGKVDTGLNQCGSCLQAWYCNQTCLNWNPGRHTKFSANRWQRRPMSCLISWRVCLNTKRSLACKGWEMFFTGVMFLPQISSTFLWTKAATIPNLCRFLFAALEIQGTSYFPCSNFQTLIRKSWPLFWTTSVPVHWQGRFLFYICCLKVFASLSLVISSWKCTCILERFCWN